MMDNKELIYIARGDTLEQAFLAMAKFINRKYIQGASEDGNTIIKRRSKAI
jgi:beta-N-acetylglucosaminidase